MSYRRSVPDLLAHSKTLFTRQEPFLRLWQAQAEVFYPERADFTTRVSDGAERFETMYASEPYRMRRDMADTWGALTRPYDTQWFNLVAEPPTVNDIDDVRLWCSGATERQTKIIYDRRSQFVRAMAQSDNDYITFGNSVVAVSDNRDRTGLLFRCLHPRDLAFAEDAEGNVEEVHEKIRWTTRQCERLFGKERLPREMQKACDKDPLKEWDLLRIVLPAEHYESEKRLPEAMAYGVCYIEVSTGARLGETGFRVFPYLVRRWLTVSGESYGRSPVTGVALADARTLNVAQRALLESIEKAVDPPLLASSETVVGDFRLHAGGVTYIDREYDVRQGGPAVETLPTGQPEYGLKFTEGAATAMARLFYENKLWLPQGDGKMTAFEVRQRLEEYARAIAPIIQPEEAHLSQLMDICFQRIMNNDGFDEWPVDLDEAEVRFEFETAVHTARKRLRAEEAGQVLVAVSQAAQLDPNAVDHVDTDRMLRDALKGLGPEEWIRPIKQVEALRAAKEEEQTARDAVDVAATFGGALAGGQKQGGVPALPAPGAV